MVFSIKGFFLVTTTSFKLVADLEAKVIGLPIFIPKHLEKYVEGIEGCINIEKDILGAKKIEDKQVDYLNKYNYNIKEKIARLLS